MIKMKRLNVMIKSMTGFGRCEIADEHRKFTVELKGVNHRYLDVNIRMPKKLNFFETSIRNLLKQYAQRGKVDIFITYEDLSENQVSLKYNHALAQEYLTYFKQMQEYILSGAPTQGVVRFFMGYAGWQKGQLEREIEENTWMVSNDYKIDLLNMYLRDLWQETLCDLGGKYAIWSRYPLYPIMN